MTGDARFRAERAAGSALAALLCLAVALLDLGATPGRLGGALLPDLGDPLFNLYLLRWGAHQIAAGLPAVWNANFFFPVEGTLALSDHLLGPAAFQLVVERLGAPPALGYNLLLFGSFALGGGALFWIGLSSGLSRGAALLASFAYSISLARWQELSHLQMLLAQWLPAVLWSFDRLLVRRTPAAAASFLAAYALHVTGGTYLAYLVHLGLAAILCVRWRAEGRAFLRRGGLPILALAGGAAPALAAAVFVPYLSLREGLDVITAYGELDPRRVTLASLVTTGPRTAYAQALGLRGENTAALWPGFGPLVLLLPLALPAAGGLFARLRARSRSERLAAALAVLVALVALAACDVATAHGELASQLERGALKRVYRAAGAVVVLAFLLVRRLRLRAGAAPPVDPWWRALGAIAALAYFAAHPAGYFPLRDLLPGFGSIRVPARLAFLAAPALCLAAGLGADRIAGVLGQRFRAARWALPLAALALLAVETKPRERYLRWFPIEAPAEFPEHVHWLARQNDLDAVVELPLYGNWREARRMYWSTLHFAPLVNGYSGYLPPFYAKVLARLDGLPGAATLAWLRRLGVSHVVVHRDDYPKWQRDALARWLRRAERAEPVRAQAVFEAGAVVVLRLERAAAPRPGSADGG